MCVCVCVSVSVFARERYTEREQREKVAEHRAQRLLESAIGSVSVCVKERERV